MRTLSGRRVEMGGERFEIKKDSRFFQLPSSSPAFLQSTAEVVDAGTAMSCIRAQRRVPFFFRLSHVDCQVVRSSEDTEEMGVFDSFGSRGDHGRFSAHCRMEIVDENGGDMERMNALENW